MIPTREEKMDAAFEEMRSALAEKDAALERCIQDLRETKEREMSLHTEILAARIDARAALAEKDKQIAILELKNRSSLANNLYLDHQDKQSGKPCLACEIEKKDVEVARLKALFEFILAESEDCKLCHEACRRGLADD